MLTAPARMSALLSLLAALCCGCASLPAPSWPKHEQHAFVADFVVGDDGELPLPSSTRDVVVRRLLLAPRPLHESFDDDGGRTFRYAPGTKVRVEGVLRVYADDDGVVPSLQQLLPGASLRDRRAGPDDGQP